MIAAWVGMILLAYHGYWLGAFAVFTLALLEK
jgi:hypothetical protein